MAKHGKKYEAALAKVDLDKEYSVREAIALAKDTNINQVRFDS
jgi:ribosomal protein L1